MGMVGRDGLCGRLGYPTPRTWGLVSHLFTDSVSMEDCQPPAGGWLHKGASPGVPPLPGTCIVGSGAPGPQLTFTFVSREETLISESDLSI